MKRENEESGKEQCKDSKEREDVAWWCRNTRRTGGSITTVSANFGFLCCIICKMARSLMSQGEDKLFLFNWLVAQSEELHVLHEQKANEPY